ncbi:MAG: hypothetical protein MRJ52_03195 [Nitrosomonas sp.]|nr:hypothetical protein [Nitrosomonas sp.]
MRRKGKAAKFRYQACRTEVVLLKNITAVDQLINALNKIDEFDPSGDPAAPATAVLILW